MICATKGGAGQGAPIYGVFLLDPSRLSPLKLVKRYGADSGLRDGIAVCNERGTSVVTPARVSRTDLQCFQPTREWTNSSAHQTHADRNVGARE